MASNVASHMPMDQISSISYLNIDRNHYLSMDIIIVYAIEYNSIAWQVNYSRYLVLLYCFSNGFFVVQAKYNLLVEVQLGMHKCPPFLAKPS
jgi:hypothetical protein